jgi:hypothetical protein
MISSLQPNYISFASVQYLNTHYATLHAQNAGLYSCCTKYKSENCAFLVTTQRVVVISYLRFGQPIVPIFTVQESKNKISRFLNPEMGPIGCPETSVKNYHYSTRNKPVERSTHLLRSGILKSRTKLKSVCVWGHKHKGRFERCYFILKQKQNKNYLINTDNLLNFFRPP